MHAGRLRAATAVVAAFAATAVPAFAAAPGASSGLEPTSPVGRIFPDPLFAGDFIQYTADPVTGRSQYLDGLEDLEERYPDVVDVDPIGDLVGMEGITSAGGRQMPVITVTDETYEDVPVDDRIDLYFSMSIHGNERAGLEGSLRFVEDLAVHWTEERAGTAAHVMTNGDPERPFYTELTTTEVLQASRLVFVDLNPDGWADGDRFGGRRLFKRGNDNGIDLNRQWPTLGWHRATGQQYHTGSQPEARAGRALIEDYLGVPEGAADLHGENNDDVLLAIMFPAGQFDPGQLAGQVELAEAIKYNVNHSVHPGAAGLLTDVAPLPVQPAEYHTAYDAIGYDDAGFQGDYLVQQGILEMDHEYAFSNLAPSSVFIPELEQVHVDTSRELLEATVVTTIVAYTDGITYEADLGDRTVAYVHNPEVLTHACQLDVDAAGAPCGDPVPEPPFELVQRPYSSTSMQYYDDLRQYVDAGSHVVAVGADDIAAGTVGDADVLVVTDRSIPRFVDGDGDLVEVDPTAFWASVKAFAEAGGTVVLTDEALRGAESMGLVPGGSVTRTTQYAGAVQNIDREHPLLEGVGGVIGQTYFEVPLGYPVTGGNHAPAWRVATSAWEAAGGTTAATAAGQAALGSMPVGDGKVTIFGAILPDATQAHPHTHGLADYAVTYGGNAVLVNALAGK